MKRRILVAYATKHGSTREVAEAVSAALRDAGLDTDLAPAAEVADLAGFDAVVLGGALYMGRLHADARHFLSRHDRALAAMPVAVFGMGPLKMEPKDVESSRHQLEHALAKHPGVTPFAVEIFGGVVHPDELHFPFSHMPAGDARDWDAIRGFARTVADQIGAPARA